VDASDFKYLKWFKRYNNDKKLFLGIVFYTGQRILSFGDNCWAIPIPVLYGFQ
jgi:hypothetical protein